MSELNINIHKLKNGKFQTCFLDPKSGKKKRSQFTTMSGAKQHKKNLDHRYEYKGPHSFSDLRVANLMKYHLEKRPHSKVTERKIVFKHFINTFGDHKISDLGTSELRTWYEKIKKERDYSEKTLASIKIMLNYFFHFLVEEEFIKENPQNKIKFNRHAPMKRPRVVLSVDEVKKLLNDAKSFSPDYLYPYLCTLANSGARREEILKLKRDDIDFDLGMFHLKQTKNGDDRWVRMQPNLQTLLKSHIESHDCEYIFKSPQEAKIGRSQLTRLINKFKMHFPQEKNWGCHCLRHSFAFNYLKAGGEMYQLQAILGHKNIGVTVDLYGQIGAQDVDAPNIYDI